MGYRVVFYCPDRHLQYDGRSPDEAGVGGGVTARVRMAAALAVLGHEVAVIANCGARAAYDGVEYIPLEDKPPSNADVLVLNTTGGDLDLSPANTLATQARLRVVWIGGKVKPAGLDRVRFDSLYVVSNFLHDEALGPWSIPGPSIFVAYNGIPEGLYHHAESLGRARDEHRLVFLGHPMKGLDTARDILQRLRRIDDRYTLHVYGGPRLWGQAEAEIKPEPGLVYHGLLGQRQLAEEVVQAGFALHLQSVEEAFGISLAESLRAGCVVLASPVGAFPELVRHGRNGFLLQGDHTSEEVRSQAVELIRAVASNPELAFYVRENARLSVGSWDLMAKVWTGHWDWRLGAGQKGPRVGKPAIAWRCVECSGETLGLADGYHCTQCGRYARSLDLQDGSMPGPSRGERPSGLPVAGATKESSPTSGFVGRIRKALPPWARAPLRRAYHLGQGALHPGAAGRARDELAKIVGEHPEAKEIFIFPPSLSWDGQLFQRPQQLAKALAGQGALVFYLESHGGRPWGRLQEEAPRLHRCTLPAEAFADIPDAIVYILTWNRSHLGAFGARRLIYDFVDSLEVFPAHYPGALLREHLALLRRATMVLAASRSLHRQAREVRGDALLCPNAVDYEHFVQARQAGPTAPPEDLRAVLDRGRPVIGYYGALAEWLDYELLESLALSRTDLSFVLIGPDYDGSLPRSGLDRLPNVSWLGRKNYAELPDYLRHFDVATIPFRLNTITHATSPLKLFEYMAGGKPVVITPMEESLVYEGVLAATDAHAFSRRLDEALGLRNDKGYLETIDRVARQNTWRSRADLILGGLEGTRGASR